MTQIFPSSDLVKPGGGQVVHPGTGELIDLAGASDDELTDLLVALRRRKQELLAPIDADHRAVCDEALRRMDQACKWTVRNPSGELVGESPNRVEYDAKGLAPKLKRLVEAGEIKPEAYDEAIGPVVRKQGVNALLKRGGDVLKALRQAGTAGLTSIELEELTPTGRAPARVWDLQQKGYRIDSSWSRLGSGRKVKRYVLRDVEAPSVAEVVRLPKPPVVQQDLFRAACEREAA